MPERRKLKRRHLIYYLRVFDVASNQLFGHLVDITTEGIMLISEDHKDVNKSFELKMVLPSDIGGKKEFQFETKSVYSKKDINPDFYDTGFLLINVDQEDLNVIDKLITRFGFRD